MMATVTKAEQSERTRQALIDAAWELFAEHGYVRTSTEELVRRAQVTRGALYYHFDNKAALFEAVYQEQRGALVQFIAERVQGAQGDAQGDLWQRVVITACRAFVERAADPRVGRILYADGPAVLDWNVIQGPAPALLLIRQVFEQLMAEGLLDPLPLDPLIHLLWATCFEAGIYIANADDRITAQKEMLSTLERLIGGLRSSPGPDAPSSSDAAG